MYFQIHTNHRHTNTHTEIRALTSTSHREQPKNSFAAAVSNYSAVRSLRSAPAADCFAAPAAAAAARNLWSRSRAAATLAPTRQHYLEIVNWNRS